MCAVGNWIDAEDFCLYQKSFQQPAVSTSTKDFSAVSTRNGANCAKIIHIDNRIATNYRRKKKETTCNFNKA